jgi:cholesterol 7alpha-monooxygenase
MPADMLDTLISLPLYALVPLVAVALILTRRFAQCLPEKRINGVPLAPLVPDWIPFIGNALMLVQGDQMWAGLMRRYGPAFRVRAMGDVRTFVCTYEVSTWITHGY